MALRIATSDGNSRPQERNDAIPLGMTACGRFLQLGTAASASDLEKTDPHDETLGGDYRPNSDAEIS